MQQWVESDIIKKYVEYNSISGEFYWIKSSNSRILVGSKVGYYTENGYLRTRISGKNYLLHRLAWFMIYGKFPEFYIDHIDGNRSNNRIENLRDATLFVNGQNRKKANKTNKLGVLGVSKIDNGYQAEIQENNKRVYIGYFKTVDEAHEAYLKAKRKLHQGNTL